ncbi:hypothetical protein [Spiroplasma floricola]|nr:hypothetical protein [Spiroplasma floricola]
MSFFIVNNVSIKNLQAQLYSIVNPQRAYPPLEKEYLNIWKKLANESIEQQNKYNDKLINFYKDSYLSLFYKYNPSPENGEIVSIPDEDIKNIILDVTKSDTLQIFIAYYLKTIFIESRINFLNDPSLPLISTDKNIVIWALQYFSAITYFQWVKIWIYELGSTVERDFNIDFYTFGSYVQYDKNGFVDWTKEPVYRKTLGCDLVNTNINKPIDESKIKAELKKNNENLIIDDISIINKKENYYAKVNQYSSNYYWNTDSEIQLNSTNSKSCTTTNKPEPMAIMDDVLKPFVEEVYNFIYDKKF